MICAFPFTSDAFLFIGVERSFFFWFFLAALHHLIGFEHLCLRIAGGKRGEGYAGSNCIYQINAKFSSTVDPTAKCSCLNSLFSSCFSYDFFYLFAKLPAFFLQVKLGAFFVFGSCSIIGFGRPSFLLSALHVKLRKVQVAAVLVEILQQQHHDMEKEKKK